MCKARQMLQQRSVERGLRHGRWRSSSRAWCWAGRAPAAPSGADSRPRGAASARSSPNGAAAGCSGACDSSGQSHHRQRLSATARATRRSGAPERQEPRRLEPSRRADERPEPAAAPLPTWREVAQILARTLRDCGCCSSGSGSSPRRPLPLQNRLEPILAGGAADWGRAQRPPLATRLPCFRGPVGPGGQRQLAQIGLAFSDL